MCLLPVAWQRCQVDQCWMLKSSHVCVIKLRSTCACALSLSVWHTRRAEEIDLPGWLKKEGLSVLRINCNQLCMSVNHTPYQARIIKTLLQGDLSWKIAATLIGEKVDFEAVNVHWCCKRVSHTHSIFVSLSLTHTHTHTLSLSHTHPLAMWITITGVSMHAFTKMVCQQFSLTNTHTQACIVVLGTYLSCYAIVTLLR